MFFTWAWIEYFSLCLQLLIDFREEFKRVSCDALLNEWPEYGKALRVYCDAILDGTKHTQWSDEIENVLLLLNLLPPTTKKRGRSKKNTNMFADLIDKLIVYRVVITEKEIKKYEFTN